MDQSAVSLDSPSSQRVPFRREVAVRLEVRRMRHQDVHALGLVVVDGEAGPSQHVDVVPEVRTWQPRSRAASSTVTPAGRSISCSRRHWRSTWLPRATKVRGFRAPGGRLSTVVDTSALTVAAPRSRPHPWRFNGRVESAMEATAVLCSWTEGLPHDGYRPN